MKKMQQCHPTLKAAPVIINIDDARRELFIKLTKAALVQHIRRAVTKVVTAGWGNMVYMFAWTCQLEVGVSNNWKPLMDEANMSLRELLCCGRVM
jgi:hypothetical protein